MRETVPVPLGEQRFRDFIAARGADLDAQAVVYNLSHAARDVISVVDAAALHTAGLTHAGYVILMTIWISGPQETRELAVAQRVTKGAIVNAVHTLQRAGFVCRTRSEADRRLVSVELTEKGRALIEAVHKIWNEWERKVASALTRDEQRELVRMLRLLSEHSRQIRHRNRTKIAAAPAAE